MIKNVIFDIGSVIAYFDEDKLLKTYSDDVLVQEFLRENVINSPEWVKYGLIDLGYITLEEMGEAICDRTNHIHDDLVMDLSTNHARFIDVQDKVLDLIDKLRNKGYKVYILSNTNAVAMKRHDEKNLTNRVDGHVYSYEVNMIKPYIGIYKELLNKYNLNPDECIFLDDREANVDTSCNLGIHGEKVIPNSYDSLIDSLKKYNIELD